MSEVDAKTLAARFEKMTGADRLRLAAGLLDRGELDLALTIVKRTADELALLKFLQPSR